MQPIDTIHVADLQPGDVHTQTTYWTFPDPADMPTVERVEPCDCPPESLARRADTLGGRLTMTHIITTGPGWRCTAGLTHLLTRTLDQGTDSE